MIGARQTPKEEFYRSSIDLTIRGHLDFVLMADRCKLLLPVEVKTKWVLSQDNIVELYNTTKPPKNIVYPIEQIFGYMACNGLQYGGVLSTYDKSWLLRRPHNNPYVCWVKDFNPTLIRCFKYILSLARLDLAP